MSRDIEKIFLWVIKIGLWAIPFLPLYVSTTMLFPFITGKSFAFRIIIEALFVFWVGLAVAWPKYRPRLTPLVKLATVFIFAIFLANLLGANPYRSFFSNYERMEGFMMLFHLYLYFLMLVSVFQTRKDWLIFFHSTLIASFAVALIGFLQRLGFRVSIQGGFRVDSTIGNPAYLAAYLSFHVWTLLILLSRFWKNWWLRIFYLAVLLFEGAIIYFTATRGAILSFLVMAPALVLACLIFWSRVFPKHGGYRKWATALLLIIVLVPIILWQLRAANFVKQSPVLARLTSVSVNDKTTQARFSIWKMAWQGVKGRPVFGWGQENFYLIFQKYFDPKLYSSEPWFDRSHNVFFDWLVHAGMAGFASFFLMLAVSFQTLWRAVRGLRLDFWSGVFLAGALITYFIQNLFVFDNLNTYLLLFAFLAHIDFTIPRQDINIIFSKGVQFRLAYYSSGLAFVLFLILLNPLHLKPIRQSQTLIKALQAVSSKDASVDTKINLFRQALAYNTFGTTEVREQLASFARGVAGNDSYASADQAKIVDLAVAEMRKEIDTSVKDIKHMLFVATILARAKNLNPSYGQEAEQILQEAIHLSPTKQILYFELAQLYLSQQKSAEAIKVLTRALDLEPGFVNARANIVLVALASGDVKLAHSLFSGLSGTDIRRIDEPILARLGGLFISVEDLMPARAIYENLVKRVPSDPKYHGTLAAIFDKLGDAEGALKEALLVKELDPNSAQEVGIFIKRLKQAKPKE